MFHVECKLDDLRNNGKGFNKQLRVQSGAFDRVYISIIDNDEIQPIEILVNANELIQAVNNAMANESWETRKKRAICRDCEEKEYR